MIEIEYQWKHEGHDPHSLKDLRESRIPKAVDHHLRGLINQGMDWTALKPLLAVDVAFLEDVHIIFALYCK